MAGPKVLRHDLTENKPQMGQAHRSVTAKKFQGFLTTFNPKHKDHRRTSRSENLKIKKNKMLHSEESAILVFTVKLGSWLAHPILCGRSSIWSSQCRSPADSWLVSFGESCSTHQWIYFFPKDTAFLWLADWNPPAPKPKLEKELLHLYSDPWRFRPYG